MLELVNDTSRQLLATGYQPDFDDVENCPRCMTQTVLQAGAGVTCPVCGPIADMFKTFTPPKEVQNSPIPPSYTPGQDLPWFVQRAPIPQGQVQEIAQAVAAEVKKGKK